MLNFYLFHSYLFMNHNHSVNAYHVYLITFMLTEIKYTTTF